MRLGTAVQTIRLPLENAACHACGSAAVVMVAEVQAGPLTPVDGNEALVRLAAQVVHVECEGCGRTETYAQEAADDGR